MCIVEVQKSTHTKKNAYYGTHNNIFVVKTYTYTKANNPLDFRDEFKGENVSIYTNLTRECGLKESVVLDTDKVNA